ncbi:hypothetical protein ACRRTK_009647 [Alexandromys fortis]
MPVKEQTCQKKQARQKASFLFPCRSYRLQAEAMAQINDGFTHLKRSRLMLVCSPVCCVLGSVWVERG